MTHSQMIDYFINISCVGYNLKFKNPDVDFINMLDKYTIHEKNFSSSMNFTTAKILGNNRFVGLHADGDSTILYLGMNDEMSGVTIDKVLTVESLANVRCYDVEEVVDRNSTNNYAIIDCGIFRMGELSINEFYYVDLATYKVSESSRYSDVFVKYNALTKRHIHVQHDPINGLNYLFRVIPMDGVDQAHKFQTYIEIFEITKPMEPYIVDVLDHTVLQSKDLAIADFKFYEGFLYLLAYNKAVYEIMLTPNQRVEIRSTFPVKMDLNRMWVSRLGFDDDIRIVLANENSVYQYDWIIGRDPVLKTKYNLMPNSEVEHLFADENFVVVSARAFYRNQTIDTQYRKIWVFTERSTSYTNAFLAMDLPVEGPYHMVFQEHVGLLTVFGNYRSRNIKLSLPFIQINPLRPDLAKKKFDITLTAVSTEESDNSTTDCSQYFTLNVIASDDFSVMNTGIEGRGKYVVDSPDQREIDVMRYFFGPWLEFNVEVKTEKLGANKPDVLVEKTIRYIFKWPEGPASSDIVFLDFFRESDLENDIYAFIQDKNDTTYYIKCATRSNQELRCSTVYKVNLNRGRILNISQIIDPKERRVAFLFSTRPSAAYIYVVTPDRIMPYGYLEYIGELDNEVTSLSISNGLLMITFKLGKRVDIYRLEDLYSESEPSNARPAFRLTATIMKFFGVPYFAPVNAETSPSHPGALFLKTKTGLIALNINQYGFPEVLFQIPVHTDYDYEISRDNVLILTATDVSLYQLDTPLRRNSKPFLQQSFNHSFTLGNYAEVVSDQFFYISNGDRVGVLYPDRPSTSVFYQQLTANARVTLIDAVRYNDREYVFTLDQAGISSWQVYMNPKIKLNWGDNQTNFKTEIYARNNFSTSNISTVNFTVYNTTETAITATDKFNETHVKNLLILPNPKNDKNPPNNVTFNDREWFNGSILRYDAECKDCNKAIRVKNHVEQIREILAAKAVYDIESTYDGVFAQQYDAVFKTYLNDSIELIARIPTTIPGEPCTKIAVPTHQMFTVSLCETGNDVNMYLTSYLSEKPFTWGPSKSEARQVVETKMVDQILMIVDNEDNPFARNGGVYLYHLNLDPQDLEQFVMLDLIETDDLQIEGFYGPAFITHAELHKPNVLQNHYRLILTEGRTGGIFFFTFIISADQNEIIYLSKTYLNINKFFDAETLIPDPLRIYTVSILNHDYRETYIQYTLLVTAANWHHIQVNVTLNNADDKIIGVDLVRLYERYPWQLKPYVKAKFGRDGFFAVPYANYNISRQIVAVYDTAENPSSAYTIKNGAMDIPVRRLIGSHWVRSSNEITYDFNQTTERNMDNLIFIDVDAYNFTEMHVSRNLTVFFDGMPENQTIKMIAHNTFHRYEFDMNFGFGPDVNPDNEEVVEIIWIIILVVGFLMIIGLIIICVKQIQREKLAQLSENKESLITTHDETGFQNTFINRSSVDPTDSNPQFRDSAQSTA